MGTTASATDNRLATAKATSASRNRPTSCAYERAVVDERQGRGERAHARQRAEDAGDEDRRGQRGGGNQPLDGERARQQIAEREVGARGRDDRLLERAVALGTDLEQLAGGVE